MALSTSSKLIIAAHAIFGVVLPLACLADVVVGGVKLSPPSLFIALSVWGVAGPASFLCGYAPPFLFKKPAQMPLRAALHVLGILLVPYGWFKLLMYLYYQAGHPTNAFDGMFIIGVLVFQWPLTGLLTFLAAWVVSRSAQTTR